MIGIPAIKMVMNGGWFMALLYQPYHNFPYSNGVSSSSLWELPWIQGVFLPHTQFVPWMTRLVFLGWSGVKATFGWLMFLPIFHFLISSEPSFLPSSNKARSNWKNSPGHSHGRWRSLGETETWIEIWTTNKRIQPYPSCVWIHLLLESANYVNQMI